MPVVTSLLPSIDVPETPPDLAVVIDVLRATTAMTTALAAGAKGVTTFREIDDARRLAQQSSPPALLCGERACRPIEGFDLGNSPSEYTASRVGGRELIFTTTNGTAAIEAADGASVMILASFLNLSAIVEFIARTVSANQVLHVVCAGTDGHITGEDLLLAGAIIDRIGKALDEKALNPKALNPKALNAKAQSDGEDHCDASIVARSTWQCHLASGRSLAESLERTRGGRNLIARGYASDLGLCAAVDTSTVIPVRSAGNPSVFVAESGLPSAMGT